MLFVVPSGLKNVQCSNSGKTEIIPTNDVFYNYLYASPNDRVLSANWPECWSKCRQNHSECSVIVNGADCKVYDLSPSQSYGISKEIEDRETAFIKLCPSGILI